LVGVPILIPLFLDGCSPMPPKYTASYALPTRLPGSFVLKLDSANSARLEGLEADFRQNVFDEQGQGSWTVELAGGSRSLSDAEGARDSVAEGGYVNDPSCSSYTKEMWLNAVMYSGSMPVGKYSVKRKYCFHTTGPFRALAASVATSENAFQMLVDEIKKRIGADRESVLAKAAGEMPGVLARQGPAGKLNVAVSDISAEGVSRSDATIVADWLRGALVSTGTYNVVERSAMEKILAEQVFQQYGCTSEECAVRQGRLLNVQRMVVGSFGKFIDSYVLNIRVVDVETGRVVYSDSAKGTTTAAVEASIKALAQRLSR